MDRAKPVTKIRTCRVCGCTADDCKGCIERTGGPCFWAGPDICSACLPMLVNIYARAYTVVVGSDRKDRTFAARGNSPGVQLFDSKSAAQDFAAELVAGGFVGVRVIAVTYTVRSDGKPER